MGMILSDDLSGTSDNIGSGFEGRTSPEITSKQKLAKWQRNNSLSCLTVQVKVGGINVRRTDEAKLFKVIANLLRWAPSGVHR